MLNFRLKKNMKFILMFDYLKKILMYQIILQLTLFMKLLF